MSSGMKKFLVNLRCALIFSKKERDAFRRRYFPPKSEKDEWQKAAEHNHIEIAEEDKALVSLDLTGENNSIIIKKRPADSSGRIHISMAADNSTIYIGENVWVSRNLSVIAGQLHPFFGKIKNTHIRIGDGTSIEDCNITTYNSNARIEIGERCMVSWNVEISHTDSHPVFDQKSGRIINKVRELKIGNHVWIGKNVSILKNVCIPDDCIVGWGSVVTKICPPPHSIIAGNPAKIIREGGISWDSDGSLGYVQNEL